jgi:hypothetical protein
MVNRAVSCRNNATGWSLRMGDDRDDTLITDLELVAEGAVNGIAPPMLGEAVDLGELVHQTSRSEHAAGGRRQGAPRRA